MGPGGDVELVATIAAAVAAAVGGLLLLARRLAVPSGSLLIATAAAEPFMTVAHPGDSVTLTLSLVLGGAAPALAATAGVLWPVTRTVGVDWAAAAIALGCALVLGGLAPALLYDPAADGCNACAPDLLEVHPAAAQADWLFGAAAASALVWGPALVLVAARRLRAASGLQRRHAWPLAAGAALAVLATVSAGRGLGLPADAVDPQQQGIRLLEAGLTVVIAAGAILRVYLASTAGSRMARLVLAAIPDHALVIRSLRAAIADPSLDVRYLRMDGTLIDSDGVVVTESNRPVLRLSRDGHEFAEVVYDRDPVGSRSLLASSVASAGLALEYLAAQARLRAELRDAAAARARIVAAGDAERSRLERNLHDGAQQRLVALGLMLTATSSSTGVSLATEHAEIDAALQDLRTVARGLFPVGLLESGVPAALRELGDHTGCPLLFTGSIEEPVPLPVKMAVYQLVSDVAGLHPPGAALQVELAGGGTDAARVTLITAIATLDHLRSSVVNAEDRFVAAGGWIRLRRGGAGAVLEGEAPCVS
jgi:signal transduction histidine kinase